MSDARTRLEACYLEGGKGKILAVFFSPADAATDTALLVCPPFAEEMNKTRRSVALLARSLATAGQSALLVDLFGTGDSEGDFSAATWQGWQQDLCDAARWLRARGIRRIHLLGVRLGAFLALQLARQLPDCLGSLLLWQPVVKGRVFASQFLRLQVAAGLTGSGGVTTQALREQLADGCCVEVAGYQLAPGLIDSIDGLDMATQSPPEGARLRWMEIAAPGQGASPAARATIEAWGASGLDASIELIAGEPFWATAETLVEPALLDASQRWLLDAT